MFFQHFIECIFHFNNYEKHEKYNKFPQSERSVKQLSLVSLYLGKSWGNQGRLGSLHVVVGHRPCPRSLLWLGRMA